MNDVDDVAVGDVTRLRPLERAAVLVEQQAQLDEKRRARGDVADVATTPSRLATLLELTAAGRGAADESLAPRLNEISRPFDELPPTARDRFLRLLDLLVTTMESGGPNGGD